MSSSAVAVVTCLVVPGSSFENGLFFSGAVKCYSEIPKTTIIHGMVLDGIEPSRNWTGHFFDGIEIPRDCSGRDSDTTGLHWMGFVYYGIARYGMQKTILHGICTVHRKHIASYYTISLWSQCFISERNRMAWHGRTVSVHRMGSWMK